MTDERMINSEIYKRLSGGGKTTRWQIAGFCIVFVIVLAVMAMVAFMFLSRAGIMQSGGMRTLEVPKIMAVPGVIFIIVIVINIAVVTAQVKNSSKAIKKRKEMLDSMSDAEFYELDSQVERSDIYCETFYFLDEYLYAPYARLLIRYTDIADFRLWISHRDRRRTGASLIIKDTEGLSQSVRVMRWREFEQNYDDFSLRLNEKIAEKAGVK